MLHKPPPSLNRHFALSETAGRKEAVSIRHFEYARTVKLTQQDLDDNLITALCGFSHRLVVRL